MNLNTFFQSCIYICVCLIVFTLAINLVNAVGVFDSVDSGVVVGDDTSDVFESFTSSFSMDNMWAVVLTFAGLGSVIVAAALHSAIPIGAYIFSSVFWVSYVNALGVLNKLYIPAELLIVGTVLMLFFWGAAVAGMFSGSG